MQQDQIAKHTLYVSTYRAITVSILQADYDDKTVSPFTALSSVLLIGSDCLRGLLNYFVYKIFKLIGVLIYSYLIFYLVALYTHVLSAP